MTTLSLFNEQLNHDVNVLYTPLESPFTTNTSIISLHEILEESPAYNVTWNNDGTSLYVATKETIHFLKFPTHNPTTPLPTQPTTHPSTIHPLLVHAAGGEIVKVVASPDLPNRLAVVGLDDIVRVFDVVTNPKTHKIEFKQVSSFTTRGGPVSVTFFHKSVRVAIVDTLNIVYYYDISPTASPPKLERMVPLYNQAVGAVTPREMPPLYKDLYQNSLTMRKLKVDAALTVSSTAGSSVTGQSPTNATNTVELGKLNNASLHTQHRFPSITNIILNNVLDLNPLVTTAAGHLAWLHHQTLSPILSKQLTASPINCLALSTQNMAKTLRDMAAEYQTMSLQLASLAKGKKQNQIPTELLQRYQHYHTLLSTIQSSRQHIAVGCSDSTVMILTADFGLKHVIHQHNHPIISLSFSPDGQYLSSISLDPRTTHKAQNCAVRSVKGSLVITHVQTGQCIYQINDNGITAFTWNPTLPCAAYTSILNFKPQESDRGRRATHALAEQQKELGELSTEGDFFTALNILDFSSLFAPLSSSLASQFETVATSLADPIHRRDIKKIPLAPSTPPTTTTTASINPTNTTYLSHTIKTIISPTIPANLGTITYAYHNAIAPPGNSAAQNNSEWQKHCTAKITALGNRSSKAYLPADSDSKGDKDPSRGGGRGGVSSLLDGALEPDLDSKDRKRGGRDGGRAGADRNTSSGNSNSNAANTENTGRNPTSDRNTDRSTGRSDGSDRNTIGRDTDRVFSSTASSVNTGSSRGGQSNVNNSSSNLPVKSTGERDRERNRDYDRFDGGNSSTMGGGDHDRRDRDRDSGRRRDNRDRNAYGENGRGDSNPQSYEEHTRMNNANRSHRR